MTLVLFVGAVAASGEANFQLVLDFLDARHGFGQIFSHPLGVTVFDGSSQCHYAAADLDQDFRGIDIAALSELIVNLLLDPLTPLLSAAELTTAVLAASLLATAELPTQTGPLLFQR